MTERLERLDCGRARGTVHRLLDGEAVAEAERRSLERHLAGCEDCRRFESDLRAMNESLRSLRSAAFPESALDEVWRRTVRLPERARAGRSRRRSALAAAVAAMLIVAAMGLWALRPTGTARVFEPTPQEVAEAVRQTRAVLALTAKALRRTEKVALREVLVDDVSGSLQRVPVVWPDATSREKRSSQS